MLFYSWTYAVEEETGYRKEEKGESKDDIEGFCLVMDNSTSHFL